MYSYIARTEEVDDIEFAINELKEQLPLDELKTNSVGVVYIHYDCERGEIAEAFEDAFDFPIVGASTLAMLGKDGYMDCGIELLVMTADDVEFRVGMTGAINIENYEAEISKVYNEIKKDEKEKLILAYASKLPDHMGDDYVKLMDRLSGGVPFYGAHPCDMFTYKDFWVFANGKSEILGAAFILVYGNVKPIDGVEFSVSDISPIEGKVTKTNGNCVITVGDKTFIQCLEEKGLSSDKEVVIMEYSQTPFMVEIDKGDGEVVTVMRNLMYLKHDIGLGMFLGEIPVGSTIKISTLRSEDIGKSVAATFEKLYKQMEAEQDYRYSTIICTSCMSRYMTLAGNKATEGDAYKETLPADINLAGMYSYGEICPKKSMISDKEYNMFHNETFTILAL